MKAADEGGALSAPILRFLYSLVRCEKPLVAAVTGVAIGVGTTHASALRLRCRRRQCAVLNAIRRTGSDSGSSLKPDRAEAHGARKCLFFTRDG